VTGRIPTLGEADEYGRSCAGPFDRLDRRLYQELEGPTPSPPVHSEVGIEREDRTRVQRVGEVHQACIRQIHRYADVTLHQSSDRADGRIEAKGNLKNAALDVRKHGVGCAPEAAEQVTCLGDDRLAGHEGSRNPTHHLDARRVVPLAAVEQRDYDPRVKEDGFHLRPKPRK
jgi:hypothetical protein